MVCRGSASAWPGCLDTAIEKGFVEVVSQIRSRHMKFTLTLQRDPLQKMSLNQAGFQSLTQQRCHLSPLVFSPIFFFCPQGKQNLVFPCFSLCCRYSLALSSALVRWIWDFLIFKRPEAVEHQVMKDDLFLRDGQPRARWPLLRHVRLEARSLTFE